MRSLRDYFLQVGEVVDRFPVEGAVMLREAVRRARDGSRVIFIAGNGGNATIADHFALGMSLNILRETGLGGRALSLNSGPMLSAAVNDFGYQRMFSAQLEALSKPGDLFIALSASGKSANLASAVICANALMLQTYAVVGREGAVSEEAAARTVLDVDDAAVCEDVTMMLLHWLYCSFMEKRSERLS